MSEIDSLKKRVQDLAKEKSRFQLVTTIMTDLADVSGLDEMVHHIVYTVMDIWGGSNVILYYLMDDSWYRSDIFQEAELVPRIEDTSVQQVIDSGHFLLFPQVEKNDLVPEDRFGLKGQQETWIYPLKIGSDLIAVLKMEGIFLKSDGNIKDILTLILNYFSLALKNEIITTGRLMTAYDDLKKEIAQRIIEEERYKRTIEGSFDGFGIVDRKGRFLEVNEAYCKMSGYTREEMLHMSIQDLDYSENSEAVAKHLQTIIQKGKGRFETIHRCKDGTLLEMEASALFIENKGGQFYTFLRDLSAVKKAEKERKQLEEQYFQAQKVESIGRLAGGVAHDLNNLLSPILGYSELLSEGFNAKDSRKNYVDQILQAGLRARDLVHQLLAFSRKQALEYQYINLNDVIRGFEKLLRRTIREDVKILMTLSPLLGNIRADIGQIEQVLMNLAVNAQDAMPGGGSLLIETDQVLLDKLESGFSWGIPLGEYIRLLVSDTGSGMNKETREQIFEPFYSTKGEQGTGLGLATVYGIVKQHEGGIWVYSEEGKGTTFKIYLPVYTTDVEEMKNQEEKKPLPLVNATILMVEDNDQVRDLAYEILLQQKYHILTAENGSKALDILKNGEIRIDLLLTDVIMPEMNGKELYEHASKIMPELKVLFMSGYTDDTISLHGLTGDGVRFIQKPFTIKTLTTKVHELLTT